MEEIPPLITPNTISQALLGFIGLKGMPVELRRVQNNI
jgi:hypothetical protein